MLILNKIGQIVFEILTCTHFPGRRKNGQKFLKYVFVFPRRPRMLRNYAISISIFFWQYSFYPISSKWSISLWGNVLRAFPYITKTRSISFRCLRAPTANFFEFFLFQKTRMKLDIAYAQFEKNCPMILFFNHENFRGQYSSKSGVSTLKIKN